MLNPHLLRILHTVALLESYSRAADRLGITQPAVSMQIRKLEESVGLPLVTTRGKQVLLTDAGRFLADHAARIQRLDDEAVKSMADFLALRRGRLRIAASSTPGTYILPPVITSFMALHPGVEVKIEVRNTKAALHEISEGLADLALVGDPTMEGLELDCEPICQDCLCVVVSSDHAWANKKSVTAGELVSQPLIVREEGSNTRQILDNELARRGLKPRIHMEMENNEAVKHLVACGLGVAVLSGWAAQWEEEAGRLVRLKVSDLCLSRQLHLVTLPRAACLPLTASFVTHLRGHDLTAGCTM